MVVSGPAETVDRHDREVHRNREAWNRKPRLREAYQAFYARIATAIERSVPGAIVELGSGMGNIKSVIPDCITTDLFPNRGVDRVENAYALSFADGSISNLVLFDVFHHLRYPGTALREFHRVVAPGGRVIVFEPGIGWAGRLVYGAFHFEPVALSAPITWDAPPAWTAQQADYYAAQGNATRVFWWGEGHDRLEGWRVAAVQPFAAFAYLATGGFSGPEVGGPRAHRLLQWFDGVSTRWPRLFASRLLVVLERQ